MYHIHKTGMKKYIVPPKSSGGQEVDVGNKILMLAPVNIGIEELKAEPVKYHRLWLVHLLNIVGLFGRK